VSDTTGPEYPGFPSEQPPVEPAAEPEPDTEPDGPEEEGTDEEAE